MKIGIVVSIVAKEKENIITALEEVVSELKADEFVWSASSLPIEVNYFPPQKNYEFKYFAVKRELEDVMELEEYLFQRD